MNRLLAIVGPTATGKSALAIALARRFGGEVVACDSTAVYRGIDIGTDKVPADAQEGIRHHLVDLVEPTDVFSAAAYAAEAGRVVRDIAARGRLPILAGGTGFYYRALFRGLFPGPARNEALRARLSRLVALRGPERLHRWLAHVDADSARRIQPRDTMRIVRALEVYLVTGEPLTAHFARTTSPVADFDTFTIGLRLSRDELRPRVATRVANQFSAGVVAEVERLLAAGVPQDAHAFSGLVYRQIVEMLLGVRDEPATRELIVRENMRYARRQLVWFRQEPGVRWIDGAGERAETRAAAIDLVSAWLEATPSRLAAGDVEKGRPW